MLEYNQVTRSSYILCLQYLLPNSNLGFIDYFDRSRGCGWSAAGKCGMAAWKSNIMITGAQFVTTASLCSTEMCFVARSVMGL